MESAWIRIYPFNGVAVHRLLKLKLSIFWTHVATYNSTFKWKDQTRVPLS
jgi:hypothetical protein